MDFDLFRDIPRRFFRSRTWLGLVSVLAAVCLWWLVARTAHLPAFILPSPMQVWLRFLIAVSDGSLFINTCVTLLEILFGLFCGAGLATVIG